MAGAPWRHWGIVVRRCSDSAKEVSRSQGPLPDLAGVAHWGRVDTSVTDFVVDVLRDRGPEQPKSGAPLARWAGLGASASALIGISALRRGCRACLLLPLRVRGSPV